MKLQQLNRSVALALRVADTHKPCRPMIRLTDHKPPFASAPVRAPLPRATPEKAGADPSRIADFLLALSGEKEIGIESVMVAKDGCVVAEAAREYASFDIWKNVFSESKTLTALAVGFLFDEGKLRLDEKVADIFSEKLQPLQKLGLGGLNLRHLLTMSSLADFNELQSMTTEEWVRGYFDSGLHGAPGSAFQYNSLNSFLLSAVVREKCGVGLFAYLDRKLFKPLGIENVYWEKSPDGVEKGGWGLYIRPEDMLKIVETIRQNGTFRAKGILSKRWVEAMCRPAMRPEEKSGEFDYGLHIWVGRENGARLLNGMFGQNALTYPDTGYSIVAHASNADLFQQGPFFRLCDEYFSKNAKSGEEAGEKTNLSDAIRVFRTGDEKPDAPPPQREKRSFFDLFRRKKAEKTSLLPAEAEAFSGRSFVPAEVDHSFGVMPRVMQAVENEYTAGIERISFRREGDGFNAVFTEGEASYSLPVGIGAWRQARRVFGETEWLLGIRGRFASDEDGRPALILTVRFLETPFSRTFRFYLDRDEMEIRADEKPGKAFLIRFAETMGGDLLEKPLVGSALSKIDPDLLGYKLDALFSPHKTFREDLTRKEKNV